MGSLIEKKKKIMMMGRGSILPSEYQQVEYIEGSGLQNIQLPYGFNNADEIVITASIDTIHRTDKFMLCPRTWNNNTNRFAIVGVYNSDFDVGYGAQPTQNVKLLPETTNDGNIHTWTYKNGIFEIPEISLQRDVSWITFGGTTTELKLFYGYNAGTKGKVAYYKHKKQNGDTCELIPCYRKADGEIGMYDRINNVFYTNDGTGTITKGADV